MPDSQRYRLKQIPSFELVPLQLVGGDPDRHKLIVRGLLIEGHLNRHRWGETLVKPGNERNWPPAASRKLGVSRVIKVDNCVTDCEIG